MKLRTEQYIKLTKTALEIAKKSENRFEGKNKEQLRAEFLKMAESYLSDAEHFYKKRRYADAFACINYGHGWLDAGARIRLFYVRDSKLFAVA